MFKLDLEILFLAILQQQIHPISTPLSFKITACRFFNYIFSCDTILGAFSSAYF